MANSVTVRGLLNGKVDIESSVILSGASFFICITMADGDALGVFLTRVQARRFFTRGLALLDRTERKGEPLFTAEEKAVLRMQLKRTERKPRRGK